MSKSKPPKSALPRITHDAFMKKILSDRDAARSFLHEFLPGSISGLLDIDAFTYQESVFHNEKMQVRLADMVFEIPVKNTVDAVQVSVLFELKSHKDPYVWLQILEYLATAYRKQLQQKEKRKNRLQLIIPVIYYHGKEEWKQEKNTSFFKAFPRLLHAYVPEFDRVFIDLKTKSDEEIQSISNSLMKAALRIHLMRLMKRIDGARLQHVFEELLIDPYGNYLGSIIVYTLENLNLSSEEMNTFIDNLPEPIKTETMSIAEKLYRKGIEAGIEQGIEEAKMVFVRKSFENGLSVSLIANITGLPEDKIKEILHVK